MQNNLFRFNDLTKESQQKLLNLQNKEGDYYKKIDGVTAHILRFLYVGILLFLLMLCGNFYSTIFAGNHATWYSIMFILAIWLVYRIWRLIRGNFVGIKNASYVTPTQIINVYDGLITYLDLKYFTSEIEHKKRTVKTSRMVNGVRVLNIRTTYQLEFTANNGSKHRVDFSTQLKAEQWREIFVKWIDYARNAYQQNNAAYFNSWDVFQGTMPPMSGNKTLNSSGFYALVGLIAATFFLPPTVFLLSTFINNRAADSDDWVNAKAKNTVTEYILYQKNGGQKQIHSAEAIQKSVAFYDEAISKTKSNSVDKAGSEAVIKILENAKTSVEKNAYPNVADNNVYLGIDFFTIQSLSSKTKEEFADKIAEKFKENFPSEVLKISQTIDFGFKETKSILKIRIEDSKIGKNKSKFDITCEAKVANQTVYTFEMKAVTFDEFLGEFGRRAGFDK